MVNDLRLDKTEIPGLVILRLAVQYNEDGWFKESWHREKMAALGLPGFDPVQSNISHSAARGITRGFHAEPWDRLIGLMQGRALGAWVDLRPGPGFGKVVACEMDRNTSVFVPRGVANAHQVLEDNTTFGYLLEHHWTPEARARFTAVNLFDPQLDIPWPITKDRATVSPKDGRNPRLADAAPMPPRRALIVGVESSLGNALLAELPEARGLTTAQLQDAEGLDWSAFDVIINAFGDAGSGTPDETRAKSNWSVAADRARLLTDVARRHHLRYVQVSAECVFADPKSEQVETDGLSLLYPHSQALAAAELMAAGVPRHLIIRTGSVIGSGDSFIADMATAARRGSTPEVISDRFGRITYAKQLVAGIRHLLDAGAEGTYNLTGDGRVVSWVDVARRVIEISGGDPDRVRPVPAGLASDAAPAAGVLRLDKIKAAGFRPGNAWLDLIDHLPGAGKGQRPRPQATPIQDTGVGKQGPFKVLFVCTANICRSAYADVVAQGSGARGVEFSSAGTRALVGQPVDKPIGSLVGKRGNAGVHRGRQLTRDLMADADLVITMAADHRRYILDEWPALGRKAFVIGQVAREMGRLPDDVMLDGLVDHLWRHRSSEPGDEVADPYGRGDAAALAAARIIDQSLEGILGGLRRLVEAPSSRASEFN